MTEFSSKQAEVLLKHLITANKRFGEREKAHADLGEQLAKVREKLPKRSKAHKDLDKLQSLIAEAINIERKLVARQKFELGYSRLLGDEIKKLEVSFERNNERPASSKEHNAALAKERRELDKKSITDKDNLARIDSGKPATMGKPILAVPQHRQRAESAGPTLTRPNKYVKHADKINLLKRKLDKLKGMEKFDDSQLKMIEARIKRLKHLVP